MDNALETPCLACNTSAKSDNHWLSFNEKKYILFLLGNLLEIPKPAVILNGKANWDEDCNGQHLSENYWNIVKLCDGCGKEVNEASLIYGEIREQVTKFREIQRKVVETFQKSWESLSLSPNGNDEYLHKLINQCQGIIKNYDFNNFGFPFIVKGEYEVIPDDPASSIDNQVDGGEEVIVKEETSETQQILLIFPQQENEVQANQVDSENEDDPDFNEDDDDYKADEEETEQDRSSSDDDNFVEPSKPTKVRIRPSPKRKQPRSQQITSHDYKWPCPLCHYKLNTSHSLKVHLKNVHPNNSIDFNQLKLKYLQVNPSGAPPPPVEVHQKAAKHVRVSSFEQEYPHLNCKKDFKGKFPCPWTDPSDCPRIFGRKYNLIRHLKVDHLKIRLFTCSWTETEGGPLCGRTFSTENNYQYHIDEHRGTPRFKCEECNMTFYKVNYFTKHKQLKHLNEKFICEICGKGFPCKNYLHTHKNINHKDNPKVATSQVICDLCGKLSRNKFTLKIHMENVHEKVKGKHGCHLCDKGFRWKYHLDGHLWERHKLRVEGFQPKEKKKRKDKLQCEVKGCRKLFAKKESLAKHGIEVHGEDGNKPGAWNCKYCGKNFFLKDKWEHCERVHENKERRPEKCENCGKGFPTKYHLRCHQRSTHKMQLEKETRWTRKEKDS